MDERPPPDPAKMLAAWREWESGETLAGRTMSTLKTGGMRDLLELAASDPVLSPAVEADLGGLLGTWTEWEVGQTTPADVLTRLHSDGAPAVLGALIEAAEAAAGDIGGDRP